MTDDELRTIEAELSLQLPEQYCQTMRAYPFPPAQAGNCQLSEDSAEISAMNSGFRSGEFGGAAWPNHRFTFGHDGAGNHFFLDLSSDDSQVYCIDHETHEITTEATDLAAWVAARLRDSNS